MTGHPADNHDLTDIQWCVIDLLIMARIRGLAKVSRLEMLGAQSIPLQLRLRLVFAALTMPSHLVTVDGADFCVTDDGISLYRLRFDDSAPTRIADVFISMPDTRKHG